MWIYKNFPFHGLSLHSVDCCLCCAEAFLSDVIPFICFAFVACAFGIISGKKKINTQTNVKIFPVFSPHSLIISGLIFESLIYFGCFLYVEWDKGPVTYSCAWKTSFVSKIYWRDCPFPIMCSSHHKCIILGYSTLFHQSICLFLC